MVAAQPGDTRQAVRAELAAMRVEAENSAALERFAKKHPDLVKDELLAEAGATALRREIEKDLKKIGVTDEVLAPVRGDTPTMIRAYSEARIRGRGVRSPDEVFDAAGQILDDKFNLPRTRSPEAAPDAVVRRMREARGLPAEDEGDSRRSARHMPQQNSTFGNVRRVDPATARARPSPAEHIAKLRAARGYLLTD